MSQLPKEALIARLRVQIKPLYLHRLNGERVVEITPEHAIRLLQCGTWHACASAKRIKSITEVDPRPERPWRSCWRTNGGAAILPPSAEYWQRVQGV